MYQTWYILVLGPWKSILDQSKLDGKIEMKDKIMQPILFVELCSNMFSRIDFWLNKSTCILILTPSKYMSFSVCVCMNEAGPWTPTSITRSCGWPLHSFIYHIWNRMISLPGTGWLAQHARVEYKVHQIYRFLPPSKPVAPPLWHRVASTQLDILKKY